MSFAPVPLDRDALYYPYIHFRDVNWLKATVLSFPQIRRIVPEDFALNDSEEVQQFRTLTGARNEPLIKEEPAFLPSAEMAQLRLLQRLQTLDAMTLNRFNRSTAAREFDGNIEKFQIHRGKMYPLLDFLLAHDLAWPARNVIAAHADWFAVHPKLGEAVMSAIAIAIAREKALDIVTSSGSVHHALRTLDEDAVFEELAGLGSSRRAAVEETATDKTDDVVHLVMLTTFDLKQLTPAQITELIKEGKDLRAFKAEVARVASSIPTILDAAERENRLRLAADEILENWQQHKKSMPRFALDAIVSALDFKSSEVIVGATAAASGLALASGTGLIIGLAAYGGYKIWRGFKEQSAGPYSFLSNVVKSGAIIAAPVRARETSPPRAQAQRLPAQASA